MIKNFTLELPDNSGYEMFSVLSAAPTNLVQPLF